MQQRQTERSSSVEQWWYTHIKILKASALPCQHRRTLYVCDVNVCIERGNQSNHLPLPATSSSIGLRLSRTKNMFFFYFIPCVCLCGADGAELRLIDDPLPVCCRIYAEGTLQFPSAKAISFTSDYYAQGTTFWLHLFISTYGRWDDGIFIRNDDRC